MNDIILVDENDREIGTGEKMQVHRDGKLHRCFSIFVFNSKDELMLQKRADEKYHSPGLWTNTCCSHPAPSEETVDVAHRRLKEEMGLDTELKETFSFTYKANLGKLTEYEYDHVFVGRYDKEPELNPEEASDWKWTNWKELIEDIKNSPEKYSSLSLTRLKRSILPSFVIIPTALLFVLIFLILLILSAFSLTERKIDRQQL